MTDFNQTTLAAAREALAVHAKAIRLETTPGEPTLDLQVWHLLVSLRRLCEAEGIDWRFQVEDAETYQD